MIERLSPNQDARPADTSIDMLVIHYTGMESAKTALDRLVEPEAKVSAHYLIDEVGTCYRLVDEDARAWHAGVSFWRGATDINARSLGIELVNPGHELGYRPFPSAQMAALLGLAGDLVARHAIPPRNVVGHADIAPRRKMDPGELFSWPSLAAQGIGLWPEPSETIPRDRDEVVRFLDEIGYETEDLYLTLRAFQRHYRPMRVNGRLDFETARLIAGLREACAVPAL